MGNTRPKIGISSKFLKNEKGATLVWVALLMPILIGFCALVIDIGRVALEKHRLQNAIDAACLAGVSKLPDIYGYNGVKGAISIACDYLNLNGYDVDETKFVIEDPSDSITPTFTDGTFIIKFTNGRYTINITCSKTVENFFGKAVGFNDITVHPRAAATRERNAFDYSIFHGTESNKNKEQLDLPNKITVTGGRIHSNNSITINGKSGNIPADCYIPDGCEAVNVNPSGDIIRVDSVPMPNLLDLITVSRAVIVNPGGSITEDNDVTMNDIKNLAAVNTINGEWDYDGRSIDGGIYVDGNLKIKSGDINGKGCIIAKGTITYEGSGAYAQAGSAVCLSSLSNSEDAITLDGSQGEIYGIVYAPYGGIKFSGIYTTVVHGRLIGNTVNLNGAQLTVDSGNLTDRDLLPYEHFKLTQ